VADKKLTPEEIEALRGDLLPDREAMSLIQTDPMPLPAGFDEMPAGVPGADTGTGAAHDATGTAGGASHVADADASGHGTESVTDENRSETINQSDSASSTT
jgi:hypothetical protein